MGKGPRLREGSATLEAQKRYTSGYDNIDWYDSRENSENQEPPGGQGDGKDATKKPAQ